MKFSIIIAAYNVEQYIETAIESCIKQKGVSRNDYEIIIVDDGSTDNTAKIIDRYKSFNNVEILHQYNQGLSVVRNNGIKKAQGQHILFLDGDDWLTDDCLISLIPLTCLYDLIVFPMLYYYSENNIQLKEYKLKEKSYTNLQFLHETIGQSILNITPAPCKCYKKQVLLNNEQYFINGILHEDGPFFMDTMKNFCNIYYLNKGLYFYRQDRMGSICSVDRNYKNFEGVLVGQKKVITQWGLNNKDAIYYLLVTTVFQPLYKYSEEDKKKVFKYYRKWKIKKFLFKLLVKSTFHRNIFILGCLLLISPDFLNKIYKWIKR